MSDSSENQGDVSAASVRTNTPSGQAQRAYLGVGGNIGERGDLLSRAVLALVRHPMVDVRAVSSLYETPPMYLLEQPPFWNACVELDVRLTPHDLLELCLEVEAALGRVRRAANGPRTVDVDVLFVGAHVLHDDALCVPHPLYKERAFVLGPMVELAPQLRDPVTGDTMRALWQALPAQARASIRRIEGGWSAPVAPLCVRP